MAIQRIPEPASVNPVTNDWQALLNKLTLTTGAFLEVAFVDDGINAPKVKAGSRFEVNGSFFIVTADEAISGYENMPANAEYYIYAIPNTPGPGEASTATFSLLNATPSYDPMLGGFFNGNNRAIGFHKKTSATAAYPRTWAIGPTPAQNVRIEGIWYCKSPPLPTSRAYSH